MKKKRAGNERKFADCEGDFGGALTKASIFVTPKSDFTDDFVFPGGKIRHIINKRKYREENEGIWRKW